MNSFETPDHPIIGQLRELSEADPFQLFTINVGKDQFLITSKKEIGFTSYGNPKVYRSIFGKWYILNRDAISHIALGNG